MLNLFICYVPFPAVFNFDNLSSFIQDAVNTEFRKNFTLEFFATTVLGTRAACLHKENHVHYSLAKAAMVLSS